MQNPYLTFRTLVLAAVFFKELYEVIWLLMCPLKLPTITYHRNFRNIIHISNNLSSIGSRKSVLYFTPTFAAELFDR